MVNEREAALFFEYYYILLVIGVLEPHMTDELDQLSPPGVENWRQIMRREHRIDEEEVRTRFLSFCETMSDDDAVEALLAEYTQVHLG